MRKSIFILIITCLFLFGQEPKLKFDSKICFVKINSKNMIIAYKKERYKYSGTVKVWNFETNKVIDTLIKHTDCKISVDKNNQYAVTNENNFMKLWDIKNNKLINIFKTNYFNIEELEISNDGNFVVYTGSGRGTKGKVTLWDIHNKKHDGFYTSDHEIFTSISINKDNKFIAASTLPDNEGHKIYLWNIEDNNSIKMKIETDSIDDISLNVKKSKKTFLSKILGYSINTGFIIYDSWSYDNEETINILDLKSQKLLATFKKNNYPSIISSNKELILFVKKSSIQVWKIKDTNNIYMIDEIFTNNYTHIHTISDDNRFIIFSEFEGNIIKVFDRNKRKMFTLDLFANSELKHTYENNNSDFLNSFFE